MGCFGNHFFVVVLCLQNKGSTSNAPTSKRGKSNVQAPDPRQFRNTQPWLELVRAIPQFHDRMELYLQKGVQPSKYVNWEPLKEAGLFDEMREMLRHEHIYNRTRYVLREWEALFSINEPVYPLLTKEFLATLTLHFSTPDEDSFMQFRLGGVPRSMTLLEFVRVLGIYGNRPDDMLRDYFESCEVHSDDFSHLQASEAWGDLAPGVVYRPSVMTASSIPDIRIRCLQRFVANTINYRKESNEKVSNLDIWFMDKIVKQRPVHLPHMILSYLREEKFQKEKSPGLGGHFVTMIARSLDIDTTGLDVLGMAEFGRTAYINGKILMVVNGALRRFRGPEPAAAGAAEDDAPQDMPQGLDGGDEVQFGPHAPRLSDVMNYLSDMRLDMTEHYRRQAEHDAQVDTRLDSIERDISAIRYDLGWSNYRGDYLQQYHQSTMPPTYSMDHPYQYPHYFADPSHPPQPPVFQYPFQGQPSTSTSYQDPQQHYHDQQQYHDQGGYGGPSWPF